jgi:hypothetical protein
MYLVPEKAVTEPVNGELDTIENVFPLLILPVMEVVEFTLPCTVSTALPPPLAGVP